jgi:hypothetical protein
MRMSIPETTTNMRPMPPKKAMSENSWFDFPLRALVVY